MSAAYGVTIGVAGGLLVMLAAIAQSLLVDETRAWLLHVSRWLVRSSARRLPEDQRERYEEEWLAELATWKDRPISGMAKAAHIRWHARALRISLREDVGVRVPLVDRSLACLLLAVVAPTFALIAAAIRQGSPGPVFWHRFTFDADGELVPLPVTFRTIALNADPDDSKRLIEVPTSIGRALQRTGLEYLPALFGVALGQVALRSPDASLRQTLQQFISQSTSGGATKGPLRAPVFVAIKQKRGRAGWRR